MSEAIQNERRTAETRKALKLAKGRALYWSGNHSFSGERFSLDAVGGRTGIWSTNWRWTILKTSAWISKSSPAGRRNATTRKLTLKTLPRADGECGELTI